jgi:hypothetical protein
MWKSDYYINRGIFDIIQSSSTITQQKTNLKSDKYTRISCYIQTIWRTEEYTKLIDIGLINFEWLFFSSEK